MTSDFRTQLLQAIQDDDLQRIDEMLADTRFEPTLDIDGPELRPVPGTPFEIACQYGSDAAILRFWERDKARYLTTFEGFYRLMARDRVAVMTALLGDGLSAHHADEQGATLLFFAKSKAMIELLVAQGADVHATDEDEEMPVCVMIYGDKADECVHTLTDLGFDVTTMECYGTSVFSKALHFGSAEAVIGLMECGCRMPPFHHTKGAINNGWTDLASWMRINPTIAKLAGEQYPGEDIKALAQESLRQMFPERRS